MASSSTSTNTKKITLKSSDGETFEVDEAVALQSQTIKHMVEDISSDEAMPLPNVTGKILAKVIEYCTNKLVNTSTATTTTSSIYIDDKASQEELKEYNKEFLNVDQDTLFDLILAANYLDIKVLMDLTCKKVADMIEAAKTPEGIRAKFHIVNDYSPEQEAEVREENAWAFE